VWVGNFDRTPLRDSTGVTGAGPIFHAVMLAAERRADVGAGERPDAPIVATPDDVASQEVCALSGMRGNAWCPTRRREWVAAGGEDLPCSWHHLSDERLLTIWPPEYSEWATRQGLIVKAATRPEVSRPSLARAASTPVAPPLRITSPPDGATYLIDPTLRREFQSLAFRATAARPTPLKWSVNGSGIGEAAPHESLPWPLTPGTHRITARDATGREATATIVVR
jgi:penicillin-binding protein 1C